MAMHTQQAFANLRAAKLRSFLAILGILVGTASVVALISIGQSATRSALAQFKALGTDLLAVSLFRENRSDSPSPANTLSLDEIHKMQHIIPNVTNAAPYTVMYKSISFNGKPLNGVIIGADDSLRQVIKIPMAHGHFVSFLNHYEHFAVLGHKVSEQIKRYTRDSLIGQQIWLGNNIYTIIGIAKPWPENSFFNQDVNNSVMIPLRGSELVNKDIQITNFILQLKENTPIDTVIQRLKNYVRQHAPDLRVFPRSAKQIIERMQSQGKIFTLLLGMIGGISLLVGGIGVMNVMLVSVTERRREIGIRMAIGAKRRDIKKLFIIESIVLALLGGFLGVIIGIGISKITSLFVSWDFYFNILPPLVGFLVSVATGIFFGFYPAYRASKLNPIETLRYE